MSTSTYPRRFQGKQSEVMFVVFVNPELSVLTTSSVLYQCRISRSIYTFSQVHCAVASRSSLNKYIHRYNVTLGSKNIQLGGRGQLQEQSFILKQHILFFCSHEPVCMCLSVRLFLPPHCPHVSVS